MLAFSPLIYRDLFHASDVGTMKVNEIANLADVSPDTVRFYNREGLLRPRKDPRNGYNLYNSEDLWRLRFVRVANKLGFNLREVKVILSHGTEGGLAGSDLKELFTDRLCRLDQELKELKRLRDDMKTTVQVWRQMPDGYDATAKLVNTEIEKLGDAGTFADLAGIDKKLGLTKGTSWEMGGYADYFAFEED